MHKYLDDGGLTTLINKIKNLISSATNAANAAIHGIKVNGTAVTPVSGVVDISVPTPSSTSPVTDGAAAAGTSTKYARADHVHPTDTSREAAANKEQTLSTASTIAYPSSKAVADFVNSSIATNTANFKGTLSESTDLSLTSSATNTAIAAALNSYSWSPAPTNNDYCFVSINDSSTVDIDEYRRFKFNGSTWEYEYTLNNSSFTQAQWDAINSGINSTKVSAYSAHVSSTSNPHSVTKAQVGLGSVANTGDSATPVSGGTTKFTTGGAYTELAKKVDKTTTVNGHALSSNVTVTKSDVGLGSVNNTADANKAVASAGKLTTARKVYVKLGTASTTETKDFSGDTTIPVDGTLSIANGGTGQTTAAGIVEETIQSGLSTDDLADVTDNTDIITSYHNGYSSPRKKLYRRKATYLWNYIKGKMSSVFGISATKTDNAVARWNGTDGALQNSLVTIGDDGIVTATGYSGIQYIPKITIQRTDVPQSRMNVTQLVSWLQGRGIPFGNSSTVVISTTWNYDANDILQLQIDGKNYELQLAGVLIEFMGNYYPDSATGVYRLRIHSSPTTAFTPTSGYSVFPTKSTAEYTFNGNSYSPSWRMILNDATVATVAKTGSYNDLSDKPSLGTAASKNVPSSGNASSSQVVMGNDTRLFTIAAEKAFMKNIFRVGMYYCSENNDNPQNWKLSDGTTSIDWTWKRVQSKFIWAKGDNDGMAAVGDSGGSSTVSASDLPGHSHTLNSNNSTTAESTNAPVKFTGKSATTSSTSKTLTGSVHLNPGTNDNTNIRGTTGIFTHPNTQGNPLSGVYTAYITSKHNNDSNDAETSRTTEFSIDATHTHNLTAEGYITGTTDKNTSKTTMSIMPPYESAYCWKRIT